MILQCARHDLAGAGAALVYQHRQRHIRCDGSVAGAIGLGRAVAKALDEHDLVLQEDAGDRRRLQEAARIAAQVKDDARGLALQRILHRFGTTWSPAFSLSAFNRI